MFFFIVLAPGGIGYGLKSDTTEMAECRKQWHHHVMMQAGTLRIVEADR